MTTIYDVAVVGAGPAGLVAATVAARHALSTIVFDEQAAPGGQVYRALTTSPPERTAMLGPDYARGAALVEAFRQSGAICVFDATVWAARRRDDGLVEIGVAYGAPAARSNRFVIARAVIVATGALERPFPIPGWTLPGVMAAGAAQVLLKGSGIVADGRVVLAGTGPLLWLLASQYLRAGVKPDALLDTTPRRQRWAALPEAWNFARSPYFRRGVAMLLHRSQPGQGVSAMRDGTMPGPFLRAYRHRAHRARAQGFVRCRRVLSDAVSGEADHARGARVAAHVARSRTCGRPHEGPSLTGG